MGHTYCIDTATGYCTRYCTNHAYHTSDSYRTTDTYSNSHSHFHLYGCAAEDGSPRAGNRVELEALLEQVHHKQTAQMAMLTAHKERLEWDHEGGQPPLHSHFGQVCPPPPDTSYPCIRRIADTRFTLMSAEGAPLPRLAGSTFGPLARSSPITNLETPTVSDPLLQACEPHCRYMLQLERVVTSLSFPSHRVTHLCCLQEAAIAGDLAAAQASHLSEPALDTSSSSSSTNSHESLDSPPETQTQTLQSPWSAHHASGSAECAHQLRGGARRTPMSPQPSRPPPLALTRQLSQSAPSSPHRLPPSPSGNPSGTPSDAPNVANTKGPISTDDAVPGGIQIPTRAGQQGWGDQLTHASAGGSEGGLLGPLNGVSLPDGYMADTEVAAARHRLHHPSISFTDSGVCGLLPI